MSVHLLEILVPKTINLAVLSKLNTITHAAFAELKHISSIFFRAAVESVALYPNPNTDTGNHPNVLEHGDMMSQHAEQGPSAAVKIWRRIIVVPLL